MDVLVRYSEISKKKGKTRQQLVQALRQRIQDKLDFEKVSYHKVSERPGRIFIFNTSREAAESIKLLPGVKSCSPAKKVEAEINTIEQNLPKVEGSFGVRVNTRDTDFSSPELERKFGSIIQEKSGAEVDLENPDTWVKIEISKDQAHIYTETLKGPGGLPAATQGRFMALISGGIDSPVAAYQMMKRGTDITPIYFYNRPYSAEDHLMRFEKAVQKLREVNPSKKWKYYVVDMMEANQALEKVDSGRMILHRRLMFEVADKLRKKKGLDGIVTGESISQKSSQTPQNLATTSQGLNIFRPLLTWEKDEITEKAREIGTFQYSKIDSACKTLSRKSFN
ncbi:MAG: THUMP domain-containing protein [Candidatus Nanohaloarchaea archaeon]